MPTYATKDYQQTKMYVIRNKISGKQYVGHSTYKYLSQRLRGHVNKFKYWKLGRDQRVSSSVDVLSDDPNEYEILLLENYPCNNVDEARGRERYWIENVEGGCVNKTIPSRTNQEYQATWREENVIIIQCECGGSYQNVAGKKERHVETLKHKYYVEHGVQKPITDQKYLANREKILARQKERDRIRRSKNT
jgi:hypothetical protein